MSFKSWLGRAQRQRDAALSWLQQIALPQRRMLAKQQYLQVRPHRQKKAQLMRQGWQESIE
ncbi:hypothetical protein [Aeromonas veronii]|uniref:hypothetical protein n=1 Tax=Aeromonas veronii TaxID=654 RepID=UPI002444E7DB|nr:hypothetical protein [Aeromonas veronii]